MKKRNVRKLLSAIAAHTPVPGEPVAELLSVEERSGFTHLGEWQDYQGGVAITFGDGERIYAHFVAWRGADHPNGFYLVLYDRTKKKILAEVHKSSVDGTLLSWRYSPARRDGDNEERSRIFEREYGSRDVSLEIPKHQADVGRFLVALGDLAHARVLADSLGAEGRSDIFPEGRRTERMHLVRERDPALRKRARELAREKHGRLFCSVCGFDFGKVYGEVGADYIEMHHTIPVSDLGDDGETRLEDVALVCANCHRMLHRRRPWLSIEELEQILRVRQSVAETEG